MPLSKSRPTPVIGITLGEPAGVGPEVIEKALSRSGLPKAFSYRVFGTRGKVRPGKPTVASAKQAMRALNDAVTAWKAGEIAAVVTGPVQKATLTRAGFPFPGQTEFFAKASDRRPSDAVMMLTDRKLTVSLCSTHCSLRKALSSLTSAKIRRVSKLTTDFLQTIRSRQPRIAIAGVNPHASEGGLFGDEEQRILEPVIAQMQAEGVPVSGPHSPDTVFHRAAQGEFDAVICAYHDQGLIPFKLLAFTTGVNVTLGLPIIRTSPDHGTALDIAGTGEADDRSMFEAICLAARLVARAKTKQKLSQN